MRSSRLDAQPGEARCLQHVFLGSRLPAQFSATLLLELPAPSFVLGSSKKRLFSRATASKCFLLHQRVTVIWGLLRFPSLPCLLVWRTVFLPSSLPAGAPQPRVPMPSACYPPYVPHTPQPRTRPRRRPGDVPREPCKQCLCLPIALPQPAACSVGLRGLPLPAPVPSWRKALCF